MNKVVCAVGGGLILVLTGCSHEHVKAKPEKCHALALSGGGDRVAWVAGVVHGLVNTVNNTSDTQWQVVSGASTGAFLASFAATYQVGDELKMSSDMIAAVSGFTNVPGPAHVSMSWPPTVDAANQSGLLNSSVLSQTLTSIFSGRKVSDRQFSISGVSDETGKLMIWDDTVVSSIAQWVVYISAAMSSPGIDEPVTVDGEMYSSGSVVLGTDVFSAILKCQSAGYENSDIVVDVVTGNNPTLSPWNATTDDVTMKLAARGDELAAYNLQMNDIFDACDAYPNVSWRYFVQPGADLPSAGDAYNATEMSQMVEMGIVDAQNAPMGGHCSIADSFRRSKKMSPSAKEDRAVDAPKCYAMALSGGGAKGAYEAGVLKGLIDRTNASEHQWQLFTGISAGSILSAGAALFDVGSEEAMADFLMENILKFTNHNSTDGNVYVDWSNPMMQLTESGFENTNPLFETLKALYSSRPLGNRKFSVGAVRDADGELIVFDESNVINEDGSFNPTAMATFVRASAAIPGVFESVKIDGTVYNDGGVVMGTNIYSAVNRCKAAGYAESDIVMDTITCNSARLSTWNETLHNHAGEIKARAAEIQSFALGMADIFDACRAYPEVNWRYYVQAPTDLPGSAASFDEASMNAMLAIGLRDAANASVDIHCSQAEHFRKSRIVKDLLQPQEAITLV